MDGLNRPRSVSKVRKIGNRKKMSSVFSLSFFFPTIYKRKNFTAAFHSK